MVLEDRKGPSEGQRFLGRAVLCRVLPDETASGRAELERGSV